MTQPPASPVFAPLGDSAVLITLGDSKDSEVNRRVHACAAAVRKASLPGVLDVVPAYASLAVYYQSSDERANELTAKLRELVETAATLAPAAGQSRLITIPVRYDGPDLRDVGDKTGLSADQIIAAHGATEYRVYMMGFAPGFAYMGDLDPALHLPRRESPRTRVPRGSVAIAGSQTAVYPLETPGGWHLIGSTELVLFDAACDPPCLLAAGDRVRFERVS